MPHYDLIIVGSGSGNSLVTPDFAEWDIALVEEGVFGGTCLNVGCIPTKMFVYPADLVEEAAKHSARLGLTPQHLAPHWAAIRDRVFGRIDPISAGGRDYRATGTPNVTLYETHADFVGPKELVLGSGETISGDRIVLATGSRAVVPPVISSSGVAYHTSDTIMRIDDLPDSIVILGGGYIASEFAHIFSGFGVDTTVVARTKLLGDHDHDISARLDRLVREKWHLHTDTKVTGAHQDVDAVALELADGANLHADLLLVATGRVPNSDRMNLRAAGVELHPDGRVVVDEYQRTTVGGIWALGDISAEDQLKHVANLEARTVAHNLAHPDDMMVADHRYVPSAVFTHPQIATVGLTEAQAAESGRPFVTAVQDYGSTAYGWAMEDTKSICKLIADPQTGLLLGAHIMGEQASTLIQPIIQAMSFGLRVPEMARGQYWIHPALTEVIENALLSLGID